MVNSHCTPLGPGNSNLSDTCVFSGWDENAKTVNAKCKYIPQRNLHYSYGHNYTIHYGDCTKIENWNSKPVCTSFCGPNADVKPKLLGSTYGETCQGCTTNLDAQTIHCDWCWNESRNYETAKNYNITKNFSRCTKGVANKDGKLLCNGRGCHCIQDQNNQCVYPNSPGKSMEHTVSEFKNNDQIQKDYPQAWEQLSNLLHLK